MAKGTKAAAQPHQIRISRYAFLHISEITRYIRFEQQSPLNADKVGEAIYATIKRIAENPLYYQECKYMLTKAKMYRQAICLSWFIIYKITATEVIILGVLPQANHPSKFKALRKVK